MLGLVSHICRVVGLFIYHQFSFYGWMLARTYGDYETTGGDSVASDSPSIGDGPRNGLTC